jgi:hypothetical protein
VNYAYRLPHAGPTQPEVFFHGEILNAFNQFQLCGCGDSVFNNGGVSNLTKINQAVRVIPAAPFNPFTSTPVLTVNYDIPTATTFGTAIDALAYTSPRIFRFSVGVRF